MPEETKISHAYTKLDITEDTLLNGKIRIYQPKKGYRVAIDPILLAAAVAVTDKQFVLDVGSGVGAASLCLASRCHAARIFGIELLPELVRLASDNARANNFNGRVEFLQGNLLSPPPRLAAGSFDHIMTNPPFIDASAGRKSPYEIKAIAHIQDIPLEQWVKFSFMMLRPKGHMTVIHRADALDVLLPLMKSHGFGNISLFPLWSYGDQPAKRILVRGEKGSKSPLTLHPGLIMHEKNGALSKPAELILTKGDALTF